MIGVGSERCKSLGFEDGLLQVEEGSHKSRNIGGL